jgi:hypothetical protein
MSSFKFCGKIAAMIGGLILLSLSFTNKTQAQENGELSVKTQPADKAAAAHVTNLFRSAAPTQTTRGKAPRAEGMSTLRSSSRKDRSDDDSSRQNNDVRFPGDLTYHGGPVVDSAQSHAIYLLPNGNCPISQCWGNPAGFLKNLAESDFIHLLDQYIGLGASERYTLGVGAKVTYTPPGTPLTDFDMLVVVHAVASLTGDTGYGHIFHVFLPPGQDECSDPTFSVCYSPDNPNTFFYCAFHGSVDFADIGHVLFSVEPFQNVPGCQTRPGTPNGQLIDSTNGSLSHELFETISDPDGTAWWNSTGLGMLGQEIGDECAFVLFTATNAYGDPFVYRIDDKFYATQPEYSNALHGCAVH